MCMMRLTHIRSAERQSSSLERKLRGSNASRTHTALMPHIRMETVIACYLFSYTEYLSSVDFNKANSEHPTFHTLSIDELNALDRQFDAIVSFSSLEHDGLGRYGDPLNPSADLQRVQNLKHFLVPDGLMYLAVPMGQDRLHYNVYVRAKWVSGRSLFYSPIFATNNAI